MSSLYLMEYVKFQKLKMTQKVRQYQWRDKGEVFWKISLKSACIFLSYFANGSFYTTHSRSNNHFNIYPGTCSSKQISRLN